ncbi:MAG: hypothetical protein ACR2MW_08070 [Chthoniobacterales bacterium]
MDKRQISLKLALDALGFAPRLETFDSRLILQKAMYLAQERGFRLGYHFSWYIRGPYSRQLTADAFAVASALAGSADEFKQWTIEESSRRILDKVTALWEDRGMVAPWLELLASVHFLLTRGKVRSQNSAVLHETLLKFEKNFSTTEIDDAVGALSSAGMLPSNGATAVAA